MATLLSRPIMSVVSWRRGWVVMGGRGRAARVSLSLTFLNLVSGGVDSKSNTNYIQTVYPVNTRNLKNFESVLTDCILLFTLLFAGDSRGGKMDIDKYLSVPDTAKELGVTRPWVYNLAKKYNWKSIKVVGRTMFLARDVKRTPSKTERASVAQRSRWRKEKEAAKQMTA